MPQVLKKFEKTHYCITAGDRKINFWILIKYISIFLQYVKFTLSWPFPIKHEWNFGGSDGTNGTYKENLVINSPLKYWWNLMSLYSNRNYMTKWLGNVLKKMHIGDSTNCNFSSTVPSPCCKMRISLDSVCHISSCYRRHASHVTGTASHVLQAPAPTPPTLSPGLPYQLTIKQKSVLIVRRSYQGVTSSPLG